MPETGAGPLAPSATSERSSSVDGLKGLLILFVIIGHILPGTLAENPLRWWIYGFHMPLFFGLAGYLVSIEKLRALSIGDFASRYARVIWPWLLAVAVYSWTEATKAFGPLFLVKGLAAPWFHLWFVPVFVLLAAAAYITKWSRRTLGMIGLAGITGGTIVYGVGHWQGLELPWPGDTWLPRKLATFGGYFFLGIMLRRTSIASTKALIMLAVSGGVVWAVLFWVPNPAAEIAASIMWTLSLVALITKLTKMRGLAWAPVAFVGRHSLFYYLWHPLVYRSIQDRFTNLPWPVSTAFLLFLTVAVLAAVRIVLGELQTRFSFTKPARSAARL